MEAPNQNMAAGEAGDDPLAVEATDRKFVVALARGLEVLRAFRMGDGFLGNSEIAERTGLPKPTVTRLTYTLCRLGYLRQMPRLNKYRLAPTAITLGYSALANLAIRQVAHRFMDDLAEALAAPVALGVLDRNRALYVDISRGSSAFTVRLEVGSRIPLAKSSMGRALIAALDERERNVVLARLAEHHGAAWPDLRDGIATAMDEHQRKGFVTALGTWRDDINAVGVPLVAADGSGVYAFNCGGPPHHFTAEHLNEVVGPAVVRMVREVDRALYGKEAFEAV